MVDEPDFQRIRQALEQERWQLLHSLEKPASSAETPETMDDLELATEYEVQMRHSSLDELSVEKLDRIAWALERLNTGAYGFCLHCKEMIPYERLLALPYTELCIACQTNLEGNGQQGWNASRPRKSKS